MSESREIEMRGNLKVDVAQINKYIPSGVEMKLKLVPNSTPFCLMSAFSDKPDYKLVQTDISLVVHYVQPSDPIVLAIQKTLMEDKELAEYRYMAHDVRMFSIPSGSYNFSIQDLLQGICPAKVVICFVRSAAVSGNYYVNCFDFSNMGLTYLCANVGGMPIPIGAVTPDFSQDHCIDAYANIFSQMGVESNGLTKFDFANGYAIYCLDFTHGTLKSPDAVDEVFPASRRGCVRIDVRFGQPLSESTTMIVFSLKPGLFTLDYGRNVKKSE
jgi:hypothetical protein